MNTFDVVIHLHVKADNQYEAVFLAMKALEEAQLDTERFPDRVVEPQPQELGQDPSVF